MTRSMWTSEHTSVSSTAFAPTESATAIGRGEQARERTQARRDAAVRVGLRRVDWIRVFVDSDHARLGAEVVGVGFRLPVTCPISLATAENLIASGIPSVTCRLGAGA